MMMMRWRQRNTVKQHYSLDRNDSLERTPRATENRNEWRRMIRGAFCQPSDRHWLKTMNTKQMHAITMTHVRNPRRRK